MSTAQPTAAATPPTAADRDARRARVVAALATAAGGAVATETFRDNLRLFVAPDRLLAVLRALRDEHGFGLVEVGGTDYLGYPGRDASRPRFEVHYVLLHRETTDRLVVKCGVSDPDPTVPSAVPLWRGADWMEREVLDMFGIRFEGHPDPRRILMPDEFTSHPLRKDYPLRGRGERHNFPRLTRAQS
jgi:NADH-quinone oxidoreductase subunit C